MTVTPEFKEASTRAAIRALRGLEQTAVMLEKWGPEAFPANEQGQVHFGRAITDSAAEAIRGAWASAIAEVEQFPDDPANWIEERGRLRQALWETAIELGQWMRRNGSDDLHGNIRQASEIVRGALGNSKLVNDLFPSAPQTANRGTMTDAELLDRFEQLVIEHNDRAWANNHQRQQEIADIRARLKARLNIADAQQARPDLVEVASGSMI